VVTIIAPENLTVTAQASVLLRALARDDSAIEGIKLWINGVEITVKDDEHVVSTADAGKQNKRNKGADDNVGDPEYQISRMIALAQGENKIRIAVYDSDANEAEQELTVIRNTPDPAEAEDMPANIQVTIFTPANESVVSLPFTLLSGEAKGKERIINVRVFVNGAELPMARDLNLVRRHPKDAGGEPPYKIDRRVPLRVGRNSVKLVAETASGKTGEKYIVVNRIGELINRPTAPQVAIYEPKNGLQTTEASINLRGEVFGDDLSLIISYAVCCAGYYDWIVRFKNASNLCPT
jgi:hypothetical protein